jgi:hypothetical protein
MEPDCYSIEITGDGKWLKKSVIFSIYGPVCKDVSDSIAKIKKEPEIEFYELLRRPSSSFVAARLKDYANRPGAVEFRFGQLKKLLIEVKCIT